MEELCEGCNALFKIRGLGQIQKLNKCLDMAVYQGHAECVGTLIDAGADVNAKTYLYTAVDRGHEVCVEFLLNAGADVNASHQYNQDIALVRAAIHGHRKCLRLLIEEGADLDAQDHREQSAMYHAAWGGHDECVRVLAEAGADVNLHDDIEDTPIKAAASQGNPKCVKALIEGRADVNTGGCTPPLHAAVDDKNPECALLLLKAGANVNIREAMEGDTPLMFAAKQGMVDIVQSILEKGADVNAKNNREITALNYAAMAGNPECIEKLLAAGADVNGGEPVLFNAACTGCNIKSIKLLLKAGAHVNIPWSVNVEYLPQNKREVRSEIAKLMLAAGEVLDGTAANVWYHWWGELKQANKALKLKHMSREAIRKHLIDMNRYQHLFYRIPKLNLPKQLKSYLLYDVPVRKQKSQ